MFSQDRAMDNLQFAPPIYIAVRIEHSVPSKIKDVVCSEPSGRVHAFVMFAGALVMMSIYLYYGSVENLKN